MAHHSSNETNIRQTASLHHDIQVIGVLIFVLWFIDHVANFIIWLGPWR